MKDSATGTTRDTRAAAIAVASALVLTAVTAVTTYSITKRSEESKQTAIISRQYQREKILKEKTAAARKIAQTEPESGTLLEDVKVDKVLLCGSILPRDFPWSRLLEAGQIGSVRNEYGVRDTWVRLVAWFVRGVTR